MSTAPETIGVLECLFGKTRRSILALLFHRPDESFHLRNVLRLARVSPGAGQRELARLAAAGIVTRTARDNQVRFQANPRCPIFTELKGLV
jgi:predicted transcriptional regulator